MAGIYFHIPWCRTVCIYCDFHFSVSTRNRPELIECMIREIELQKNYLDNAPIESVYFGGGTPSILTVKELDKILGKTRSVFNIPDSAEISLEANPDDLSLSYLRDLKKLGINRLSIGIQSFNNDDLRWMNRSHDRKQAILSIENSKKTGFENVSIDLIYGLPGLKNDKWKENLKITFDKQLQHLSAYHLTIENKTVYFHKFRKGLMEGPDERAGLDQFEILMDMAYNEGFMHYEISNFCMPGYYSIHNTSYWMQKHYLGIGPSANSFNGNSRQWNLNNNSQYIKNIIHGIIPYDYEKLGTKEKYNEYILTSLRTMWGINVKVVEQNFGNEFSDYLLKEAAIFFENGKLEKDGKIIKLGRTGKFFADGIISRLFKT